MAKLHMHMSLRFYHYRRLVYSVFHMLYIAAEHLVLICLYKLVSICCCKVYYACFLFTRGGRHTRIVVRVGMNELVDEARKDPNIPVEHIWLLTVYRDNTMRPVVTNLQWNTLKNLINKGRPKVEFFKNNFVLEVN